ncbi:MAG TPA: MarR family winged helix-turn-helix transcriptional regulator [Caulobacteraceae bacterium]|jgi:DNA-binding MarR family transcriptional regulator|nr:MarR family winged helix-turn-helix transcriptional regulator [Caulobacteraceae bacterium]
MAKSKAKIAGEAPALAGSATHLLHRALQMALDYHTEAAGPGAITQRQFTVLAAAGAHEGLTQNDLVRATGIDRSTLADLVARMLAKGLLVRERSATDARANSVGLSDAGRTALAAGAEPVAGADARLLAPLSAKKRDGFIKALHILTGTEAGSPGAKPKGRKKAAKAKAAKAKPVKAGAKKHKKLKHPKAVLGV